MCYSTAMAKLYFHYSTMNAGKSTALLQASHNYNEHGMNTYLLAADFDDRTGKTGVIGSRIGIQAEAHTFNKHTDLFEQISTDTTGKGIACVFVDEAHWLTEEQVWQLTKVVDELKLPVMCYGLRLDFQAQLFPGSKALLAWANELREIRTVCHCGKKADFVLRKDAEGNVLAEGPQVLVGGNDMYESVCRVHWKEALRK